MQRKGILRTMNELFYFVGFAALVAGIVLTAIKKKKTFVLLGVAAFAVLGLIGGGYKIVPTGYTGVRMTFGQISDKTAPQGFNWKIPFVEEIVLVNNKQQDDVISAQVWGESSEKTPVYASDITVTFRVRPEKSAWIYTNVSDTSRLMTSDLVSSAIKSAMVELGADEVTVRSRIEPLVKEKLVDSVTEKYGADTIEVLKVVINQMDFEESYNQAISEKSVALQQKQKQEIENQTAIAKAEADKKVAITNAEAEAEATRIAAQAQAEANKLLEESLTDGILKSKFYDKWNGELPNVMGDGTVITDIR